MVVERCPHCGFDGAAWTDQDAITTIAELPARFAAAIDGLRDGDLHRRPVAARWSIAEYLDHVRETTFGMRFILSTALDGPGTDLGEPPTSRFDPEPRAVDVPAALDGLRGEAQQLSDQLRQLADPSWASEVVVGGEVLDVHCIARHAVHDATHRRSDIEHLRQRL